MASPVTGLTPVAWYDVHASTSTTAITDNSGNARADLAFGSGSNSPAHVDYGTIGPGVRFAGQTTSRLYTTANTTLFDAATSLDLRYAIALTDWTPATTVIVGTKGSVAGGNTNYIFEFYVMSAGTLRLQLGDGAGTPSGTSSVATGFTDGALQGIRATWDKSTSIMKFYTKSVTAATAFADIDSTSGWTQLGTDQTVSTTLQSVNTAMGIGSRPSGSLNALDGAFVCAARLGTAIDGVSLVEFDAAKSGLTGYTDGVSSLTWAVGYPTSGRKTVVLSPKANATRDVVMGGTDDWFDGPTTAVPSATSTGACTVSATIRPRSTQAAGKTIATTRATTTAKGVAIEMAGTNSVRAVVSDGTTTVTSASVNITLGRRTVVGAILTGGSPGTVRVFAADSSGVTLGATSSRTGNDETGGDLRCFADQSGGNVIDVESECPWVSFDAALTSTQLDQLLLYYDGGGRATLDDVTASGTGALRVVGASAVTLDDVTTAGTGALRAVGSSAVTLDAISTAASGTLRVVGAAALGLDAVTASAAGTLRVVGTLAATLDGVTDAGSGTLSLAGTAALTLDGVTVSGFGSLPIQGQVAVTLDPATVVAVGTARVVGQAAITLDGVTVAGDDLAFRLARVRLTFRERTRAAFREDTRATFREAL